MSDDARRTPPTTTTDAGIPAPSDEFSLTAGAEGPLLLQDHYLIQKMAHFNRERVPERVVHAKGARGLRLLRGHRGRQPVMQGRLLEEGHAHADGRPLLDRRRRTGLPRHRPRPPRLRDQVLHPRGQLRPRRQQHAGLLHPRPVQVLRTSSTPRSACPTPACATTTCQWDFWTLSPESAHQVTILMSDRGTPRTLRHMNGYRHPHLHVGQRRRRAVLGQVPLQDRPGHRELHRCRGQGHGRRGPRLPPRATCGTRSSAASTRAGASRCRSCRSRTPPTTGSTRST